jgi:hypothetical protein
MAGHAPEVLEVLVATVTRIQAGRVNENPGLNERNKESSFLRGFDLGLQTFSPSLLSLFAQCLGYENSVLECNAPRYFLQNFCKIAHAANTPLSVAVCSTFYRA